jgi:hypothetical protein
VVGRTSGFDTVAYSFPIRGWSIPPGTKRAHLRVVPETGATTADVRLPSGARLDVGIGGRAKVEVSVPKLATGRNVEPVPWADVVDAVRYLHAEAQDAGYVDVPGRFEDGRFVRVDVVRDFQNVQGWSAFAPRLKPHVWASRARAAMYYDAGRRSALSLSVGNTKWRAIAYDKGVESGEADAAGRIRFELRLTRNYIEAAHADWKHEGALYEICESRFTTCGMGSRVAGMSELLARVAKSDLKTATAYAVVGFVVAEGSGVELPAARGTRRRYRTLARELGLSFSPGEVPAVVGFLDYRAGELRLEAGAA